MIGMAISKVNYGDETLIDLTADTVTPETLWEGVIAHDASGNRIVGTYDPNTITPKSHTEITSNGIWNASRAGTTTFTFGNGVNRKALGATYDVSNAQFIEFDIYIPSGVDVASFDGETQFELSSSGREDSAESNLAVNFLTEYEINYGGWTHIALPLARFSGNCDLSALNFIGWYWVNSSYSISGCKVANLTFTSYNLQSKTVTPTEEQQVVVPDSDYSGLSSVIVAAAAGNDVHIVTKDCANASVVVDYFRNLRPDGCSDMIVAFKPPDDVTKLSDMTNGQMLTLTLYGTKAAYTRWYSNALNVQTTFTTSYVCKCWAGDEYYILPLM